MGVLNTATALLAGAGLATSVAAKPSKWNTSETDLYSSGGLQILTSNDLTETLVPNTGAILLSTPRDAKSQAEACAQLGETVWDPETDEFSHSLNTSLFYLLHTGQYPDSQIFHVSGAKKRHHKCRYMDATGDTGYTSCQTKLPALCTDSAPLGTMLTWNASDPWRVVQTVNGNELTGWRDQHAFKFLGLKYANDVERYEYSTLRDWSQPVGSNGSTAVDATEFGSPCWQVVGEVSGGMSEDCLSLNVWTTYLPQTGTEGKRERKPVLFNIHGGALQTGSNTNPHLDGTNVASRGDVVVVNINYRLGNLGFVAFTDGVHNGNYGLSDMITALEWVRDNIHYFGGDPDNVTITGESAGAVAVRALISSEKAKGLFVNAMEQSLAHGWAYADHTDWTTYEDPGVSATKFTLYIAQEAGCPVGTEGETLECLKGIDPETLVNLNTAARYLTNDGAYLTTRRLPMSPTGPAAQVNLMTGTDRNEAGILIPYPPSNTTNATLWVLETFASQLGASPSDLEPYAYLFPPNPTLSEAYNITEHILTLGTFACLNHASINSATLHSALSTAWLFEFNRTYSPMQYTTSWCDPPITPSHPLGDPSAEYYKCHAGEQLYVWGTMDRSLQPDRDGQDTLMERMAVDYWTAFARTGDPNPDEDFLSARGYYDTLTAMEEAGRWKATTQENVLDMMLLQVPGGMMQWSEAEMCAVLGMGIDYYETH